MLKERYRRGESITFRGRIPEPFRFSRVSTLDTMRTKTWRRLATIFGLWTLFAIYSAAETHWRSTLGKRPYSWQDSFWYEGSYCYYWAAVTPFVQWFARRFRLERGQLWRNLAIQAGMGAMVAVLLKALWDLTIQEPGPYSLLPFEIHKAMVSIWAGFTEGLMLYWILVLLTYSLDYYNKYQAGMVESAKLQTQLVQAQLQALRMQLHPHFLFNTLHSISALVHEDPEGAECMIARLSELLRLSLVNDAAQLVPLCQELRFLDLYLAIEKTRFEERLEIRFNIDPMTREAMVPSMILQPLVENSIRHGLSNRVAQGRISIHSEVENSNLLLRVIDNGAGLRSNGTSAGHHGIGLSATRGRLERLYGNAHSLLLKNLPGGGVEAQITMPLAKGRNDGTDSDTYS
jgi:two-component sensor histidine kinase